jgi:serine/threonine protein kinase/WD40 repeat protein
MTFLHQCLRDDVIRQLMACELGDETTRHAEEHLSQCDACRQAMEVAMAETDWWRKARESLTEKDDSELAHDTENPHDDILGLLGPSDHPQMLGRIDLYEVAGVIGRGGMGVVFKALDPALNRYVAIKMLAPQLAAWGAARKRFAREGQAAAAVIDDNVLPIYGVNEWRGMPYLVTQYSRGNTLQKRIQERGPLETKEILRIGMQAARGLAAAHAQGLVHRDVKPSNILLDGNVERAMLTDFGLARAVDDASVTQTGIIAGTPQYMSPEQGRGASVDARSDLFGLGCVMYAMCTGRPPFRGENSFAILKAIAEKDPQPIREINPEIPTWLCQVVSRLMAKSPDDRYASAEEVASLLGECLAHLQQPTLKKLPSGLKGAGSFWRFSSIGRGVWPMIGFAVFGILGLVLAQQNPPDIEGDWVDQEWGKIQITKTKEEQWEGAFSRTSTGTPGKLALTWSRISNRFNGTWREGEKGPFGELSIRLVDGQIRGAYLTDKQFTTDPAESNLADLTWTRSNAAGVDALKKIPHVGRLFEKHDSAKAEAVQIGSDAAIDSSRYDALRFRGHLVVSEDRTLVAYIANESADNKTAELRVCNGTTGELKAKASVDLPVGKLKFLEDGVASIDKDGAEKVLMSISNHPGFEKATDSDPAKQADDDKRVWLPTQICEKTPPIWAISTREQAFLENWRGPLFLDDERLLWGAHILSAQTGEPVGKFPFAEDWTDIHSAKLSHNRKFLVVRGLTWIMAKPDPTVTPWVEVWDVEKRVKLGTRFHPEHPNSEVDITNDGQTVAFTTRTDVILWNVLKGEAIKAFPVDLDDFPNGLRVFAPEFLRFSPDNEWLVVFSRNCGIYWRWQTDHKPRILSLGRRLETFAFSPDSRLLVEGPDSRTNLVARDVSSSEVRRTFFDEVDSPMNTRGLTFTPDGKTLIATNCTTLVKWLKIPHRIHFWDVQKGTIKRQMVTGKFLPQHLDISPDGKRIAVRLIPEEPDNMAAVAVWNLEEPAL